MACILCNNLNMETYQISNVNKIKIKTKNKRNFQYQGASFNPGILPHFLHKKPFILNVLNQNKATATTNIQS